MRTVVAVLALLVAPVLAGESLHYSVNWPSGLSLGESQLRSTQAKDGSWEFDFTLDAAVPGYAVSDHYHSTATSGLCALSLEKSYTHGTRKANERTTFDQEKNTAVRQTEGGGKSEFSISACARDALTYIQYVRHELSQGRIPPQQTIWFGAPYQIHLEYTGEETIKVSDTPVQADRMVASLKGPATDITFEIFFAKDAARTPVMVRVPLSLGSFTMELLSQ